MKDGLYLFQNGKHCERFIYYCGKLTELGASTCGRLLIDFLDMSSTELSRDELVKLFLQIKTDEAKSDAANYNLSVEEKNRAVAKAGTHFLFNIQDIQQKYWNICNDYCIHRLVREDVFDILKEIYSVIDILYVEEVIAAKGFGEEFFGSESSSIEKYTTAYRFSDIETYIHFLFLNVLRYESNFSKCNYCWRFFVPKTKKPTRFCDRVDSASGKTCKEIAPKKFRNDDMSSIKILDEYDKARHRNYMRVSRADERKTDVVHEKDLDWDTYSDWQERANKALERWRAKKISDEEFREIIYILNK